MIKRNKLISVTISALLVLSTITVPSGKFGAVNAKSSDVGNTISYKKPSKEEIANKIDKTLKNEFKACNSKISFMVMLKDQVDTAKVSKDAASKAKKQGLTSYKTDLLKKSSIVSELKIKSDETQRGIKNYLDNQKKKGNVTKYESYYIVNGLAVTGTEAVMNKLAAMPEVESISENKVVKLSDAAKVASKASTASKISANAASDSNIESNIKQIHAPEAWASGIDGKGVVVAEFGTGANLNNPALVTKYRGYNCKYPDLPNNECNWYDAIGHQTEPYDDYFGYSTYGLGIALGSCADGKNQIGVAPGAKWIAVKALDAFGSYQDQVIDGAQWLLAPVDSKGNTHPELAPDIIDNSWQYSLLNTDPWFKQLVTNWKNAGIVPVFPAGDTDDSGQSNNSIIGPATCSDAFVVGAVDADNNLTSFSRRGPLSDGTIKPDVCAPGEAIRSACKTTDSDYATFSTTIAASSCAAGVAALVLQADSTLTVDQVENIIRKSATVRTDSTYTASPNNGYGYGVVNAYLAVKSVSTGTGIVKGQVLQVGQDTVAPKFTDYPVSQAYVGMALPIGINAQDNIRIDTVELQYRHHDNDNEQWTAIASKQQNGDYKGGDYIASIPAEQITGASLQYRWRIVDYGKNEIFTDVHDVTIGTAITDGYFQNFESEPVGWTTGGTSRWQWGVPTAPKIKAASGQKVYATNLAGGYDYNADTYLEMPAIDLPAEGNSYLQFKHWFELGDSYDYCDVCISTDNTNWDSLSSYGSLMNMTPGSDYESVQIDLSAYAGKRIYIKFRLTSNTYGNSFGWFIDDVALSNQSLQQQAKTNLMLNKMIKENISSQTEASYLPIDGKITALNDGFSANTNPADGSYILRVSGGECTLQAESYGFYTQKQTANVAGDSINSMNFVLNPIPKGILKGKITDGQSGKPVADADVYLTEDAAVAPVHTDSEGNYSITDYEGNYTVQITGGNYSAESYSAAIKGNETTTLDIQLKPYVGDYEEIGYDDGKSDDAVALSYNGDAWGVRMTLADGKASSQLKTALFKFSGKDFPDLGGTDFKVEVWDATGKNLAPGKMIAGPFDASAIRDELQWTAVDLSKYSITVPHDFYIAFVQVGDYPMCPALDVDQSSDNQRVYRMSGGKWVKNAPDPMLGTYYKNIMIRSAVSYEAEIPEITVPENNIYTNKGTIDVAGKAAANLDLHIFNNNKEASVTKADSNGSFTANVALEEGTNTLKGQTITDAGHTNFSKEVNVIYDSIAPVLNVISPVDNSKTNTGAVTVQGTVAEKNLDSIKVNGAKAQVNADGTWSAKILLDSGMNTIEIVATDKAGNKTTKTIQVDASFGIQEITNLTPDKDVYLSPGKLLKVEFDSEPGLKKAVFTIHMPLVSNSINSIEADNNTSEIAMTEAVDNDGNGTGHYTGYYTIPSDLSADGAQIEVRVTDVYGNILSKYAAGKLYINSGEKVNVSRIAGINRYETSEKIAEAYGNGQKVDNVILASGANFPDALSGSVLTASLKAPMLLVSSGSDNAEAYKYIKNYLTDKGKVYILGGTGAVSQNTEDYVSKTLKKTVVRISGQDRFETNKKIIDNLNPSKGTPVIITSSDNFADALSVSSVSAVKGYPIVIANGKHLSESALSVVKNIQPSSVYVIGGTGAVDNNIITEIKDADTGINDADIIRIGGTDRYETSLKVLKQFNMNKGNLVVASGSCFADGLSGAALAAKESAPVLITDSSILNNQLSAMLKYTKITVLGGYGAVTADAENCLNGKSALPAYIETSLTLSAAVGSKIVLPETVTGYYADGVKTSMTVIWDKNTSLDTSKACTLTITGAVEGYDTPVTLTVTVK